MFKQELSFYVHWQGGGVKDWWRVYILLEKHKIKCFRDTFFLFIQPCEFGTLLWIDMAGPLRTYCHFNCYESFSSCIKYFILISTQKDESYVCFDKILMLHSSNLVRLKPLSKWYLSVVIIIYNNGQIVIYLPVW